MPAQSPAYGLSPLRELMDVSVFLASLRADPFIRVRAADWDAKCARLADLERENERLRNEPRYNVIFGGF